MPADPASGEGPSWPADGHLLTVLMAFPWCASRGRVSGVWGGRSVLPLPSGHRCQHGPQLTPITSQRLHLQTPSHWGHGLGGIQLSPGQIPFPSPRTRRVSCWLDTSHPCPPQSTPWPPNPGVPTIQPHVLLRTPHLIGTGVLGPHSSLPVSARSPPSLWWRPPPGLFATPTPGGLAKPLKCIQPGTPSALTTARSPGSAPRPPQVPTSALACCQLS